MNSVQKINRRNFVKLAGAASLVMASPVALIPLAEASPGPGRYTQSRLKMGTIVTLTVVTDSADQAREAFQKAWGEMDRLTGIFDRHRSGTMVSRLNEGGSLDDPAPELLEVFQLAADTHRVSGGDFDPTVLPLLSLIQKNFEQKGGPPNDQDVREAMNLVDFSTVSFDRRRVSLGAAEKQISLDGVAKGYIVDRAGEAIRAAGIDNALINAGGDIKAMGRARGGRPWRVAIQDPFHSNTYLKVLALIEKSVATSGSYEIFFDPKKEYHHLLDPKKGRPSVRLVSATTVAPDTALADAMATAAFINPDVLKKSGLDGLVVAGNGRLNLTPGIKRMLVNL